MILSDQTSSPILGGHQQPLSSGHVNSPSHKGHKDLSGIFIYSLIFVSPPESGEHDVDLLDEMFGVATWNPNDLYF